MADLGARYATALFQLAEERGALGEFMQQAQFLCDTFQGDEGALRILTHPLISTDEKNAFADKVYGTVIHQDLLGFMKLAIAKNREAFLLSTLTTLIEMIKLRQNQITARIVTAMPLSEQQKTRLSTTLGAKFGKRVELNIIVDPSQIAGISIHVDGYFLDRTVRTMLKGMKETFAV